MTAIVSIRTVRVPATNTVGDRFTAVVRSGEFKGKQVTMTRDDSISDPHGAAAEALVTKLDIVGDVVLDSEHATGRIFTVVKVAAPVTLPIVVTLLPRKSPITVTVLPRKPMQVVTRYAGPEGLKGSRVGARVLSGPFKGKRVTVGYDHAARDPHAVAVHAVLTKVGIVGTATESGEAIGNGYVYNIATV
jgi:hypothetical protein